MGLLGATKLASAESRLERHTVPSKKVDDWGPVVVAQIFRSHHLIPPKPPARREEIVEAIGPDACEERSTPWGAGALPCRD